MRRLTLLCFLFLAVPASAVDYTLTITQGDNGNISASPAGPTYAEGTEVTLTARGADGYCFNKWGGDITTQLWVNPKTITMNADTAVTAVFAETNTQTITVAATTNGSVSPSGTVSINSGDPCTFTFTPNDGYVVKNVYFQGCSYGKMPSYTFYGASANYTLNVYFVAAVNATPESIYVDGTLSANITNGTYSIANRSGGGSDGNAYKYISSACDVAGPGDTVLVRSGIYGGSESGTLAVDTIWPKHSGTSGAHVTIRPYNGEHVQIANLAENSFPNDAQQSIGRGPISARNVEYVDISGFDIGPTSGFMTLIDCNYITITDCNFYNLTFDWKGAHLQNCNYCTISDCNMHGYVGVAKSDILAIQIGGHNLIKDCNFANSGHASIAIRGSDYNVIRDCNFADWRGYQMIEVYDAKVMDNAGNSLYYYPVPQYDSTQHNVIQDCTFGWQGPYPGNPGNSQTFEFSGQYFIVRRNVFNNPCDDPNTAGGQGVVMRWGGSFTGWSGGALVGQGHEAGFVHDNHFYNNVFRGYNRSQLKIPFDREGTDYIPTSAPMKWCSNYADFLSGVPWSWTRNYWVNNVFDEGAIETYGSTWDPYDTLPGRPIQVYHFGRSGHTKFINNNFHSTSAYPDSLIVEYPSYGLTPHTPAYMNANKSASWTGNVQLDPEFIDADSNDFRLASTSDLIDAGAFLTTITSTSGSGTSFTVADANYFYDGYGIPGETGDSIKTSAGQATTVTNVNFSTKTITVNNSITWTQGDGVALAYDGTAPDIGASEYDSETAPPDPIATFSPADDATDQERTVTVSWGESTGATKYYLYGGTAADDLAVLYEGTNRTFELSQQAYSATYYWQVVAYNDDGTWDSDVLSFTVKDEPVPSPTKKYLLAIKK